MKNEPNEIVRKSEKLFGIYRAVVVDNDDSDTWENRFVGGSGRVRVRVHGVHTDKVDQTDEEGIPVTQLPWAEPAYPIIEGSLVDFGIWSVPIVGTHVFVFFENGDHLQPRYFACAPGIQPDTYESNGGFFDPEWINKWGKDRKGEPDYSRVARGQQDDTWMSVMNDEADSTKDSPIFGCANLPPLIIEEEGITHGTYPDILSLETHGGVSLAIDSTAGNENAVLYHPEKSWIVMYPDGKIGIHSSTDMLLISLEDRKLYIGGNSERGIAGTETTKVTGNWTVESGGVIMLIANSIMISKCTSTKPLSLFKFNWNDEHTHTYLCGGVEMETSTPNYDTGNGWFEEII